MREKDLRVRDEVIEGSSIYASYHPRMEREHKRNTERLKAIIAESGWPGRSLVGEDGMIAAWFIAQHSISDPPFQRRSLKLLRKALKNGEVSPQSVAFLEDRICMFEGRPQIYGTNFEPDERGRYRPYQMTDPEGVNERRKAIGMEPLEQRAAYLNAQQSPEETTSEEYAKYKSDQLK